VNRGEEDLSARRHRSKKKEGSNNRPPDLDPRFVAVKVGKKKRGGESLRKTATDAEVLLGLLVSGSFEGEKEREK